MTSTELDVIQPASGEELEQTWRLAQRLAKTEFVPDALRGRAEAVLAAILTGRELNIGPMQSLSSINVIKGKPSLAPELMRALVLRAGHRFSVVQQSAESVTVEGSRRSVSPAGVTWSDPQRVTWNLEDAKRANLGAKDNWKQYPRAMLLARATSELCRQVFPDVIAGASYISEEVGGDYMPPAEVDIETGEIVEVRIEPLPLVAGSSSFDATASQQSPSTTAAAATRTTDDESSMGYVDEFTIVAWRNQLANMGADARERVKKRWKATEYGVWGSDKYKKSYEEAISQLISTELQKVYDANRKLVKDKAKEVGITSTDALNELIETTTKGVKKTPNKLSAAEATAVLEEVEALRLADGAA